jgi:hypothetical protein
MPISGREFARRDGCSESMVRKGATSGKLRVDADGRYDESQVRTDWRSRTREARKESAHSAHQSAHQPDSAHLGAHSGAHPDPKASRVTERLEPQGHGGALKRTAANLDEEGEGPGGTPLQQAILAKEQATAKLKALEFDVKSGALISAEMAANVMFEEFRGARDSWLNWPASVAPHMSAELGVDPDKLVEVLTRYVHAHLSELGEPAGEFGPGSGTAAAGGSPRLDAPTTH